MSKSATYNTVGNDQIILRYADVLLMYAEAMYELEKMTPEIWEQTITQLAAVPDSMKHLRQWTIQQVEIFVKLSGTNDA